MNDISLYEKVPVGEKNYPVRILDCQYSGAGMCAHWHEHIELLFFLKGGVTMHCGLNSFDVHENDLVVVNSNELHHYEKSAFGKYYCVMIHPELFSDIKCSDMQFENIVRSDSFVKECFINIFAEKEEQKEGYDMQIKSYAYALMTHLLRNYRKRTYTAATDSESSRLNNVFEYVSNHYPEKITTSLLAQLCYLSEFYFCRYFKKITGQTPLRYINTYRIEKAIVMMENTDDTITNIASSVGFDDLNYFSRIFRQITGLSPTSYRKNKSTKFLI